MKTIGLAAMLAVPLWAQWPAYPVTGLPDMNGPAPKTADGKPDLSGVWNAAPTGPPVAEGRPIRPFFDIRTVVQGTFPIQPWAAELRAKRVGNNSKDHPDAHCLPINIVQLHSHPQPRKIVQTPGLITIIYEANNGLRQIFLDGRPLPDENAQPFWYGYSVGHWEGSTLVVESRGFRDDQWLDEEGTPMTDAGKVTERFRRTNFGSLEIEMTVDDPKAYTKPFTFKVNQQVMLGTDLIEFICLENQDIGHLVGK